LKRVFPASTFVVLQSDGSLEEAIQQTLDRTRRQKARWLIQELP